MSVKYRVEINDRVIGPLGIASVKKLFDNGHITGEEPCQIFPNGQWKQISDFPELINIFSSKNFNDEDRTLERIIRNKKENPQSSSKEVKDDSYKEFKFSISSEGNEDVDYDEIEKKYEEKQNEVKPIDKTVVIKRSDLDLIESTKVIPKVEQEILGFEVEEESESNDVDINAIEDEIKEVIDANEATQMVNFDELKEKIKEKRETEEEIIDYLEKEEVQQQELEKTKSKIIEKTSETKKKTKPIVLFVMVALLFLLLFDEEEKKIDPQLVNLPAPVTYDVEDSSQSQRLLEKGLVEYEKGTYLSKIKAANYFRKSVEHKLDDNPALGFLVLSYGELIVNARNKKRASRNLFNIIRISRPWLYKDINVAMGTALFYIFAKKNHTAIEIIEGYLRISKPSLKLLAVYMKAAINNGDLILASKIQKKLTPYKVKPVEAYIEESRYYTLDDNYAPGEKVVKEGLKRYGNSVALMLELAHYYLRKEKIKSYTKILKRVEALSYEANPSYYARYLEYVAMLSALNKDSKKAAILFKAALKINPSESLRGKLATLDIGGGRLSEKLIEESKIIDSVRRSKKLAKQKKWREAFDAALEATNTELKYLPAEKNLIRLQIQRGFFEFSINKLERLLKEYPKDPQVKFMLIDAYTLSNRLGDAQKMVSYVTTMHSQHPDYHGTVARYYMKSKKYVLAVKFLSQSTALNPLKDDDYYLMAKIYMKSRQYKEAKSKINTALDLDPLNTDYISLYSQIVYELDGAETAIGYLREQLKTHVDSAKLMGDIASYYYDSGQLTLFEELKKEIIDLNKENEDFYRFLIKAASIEDNLDMAIESSQRLLLINPGDLATRMKLAKLYLNQKRYKDSLNELDEVIERLSSYPRANYLRAKVYVQMRDYKSALKYAKLETEKNPGIYNGWYILGEVYRLSENYKQSIKNLEKAISIKPKSVEALKSLGWIKLSERFYDVARELYLRAKRQSPNDPEIRKQLAMIYRGIGQSGLAVEEYQTYLKLFPNAPDRKMINQQIKILSR